MSGRTLNLVGPASAHVDVMDLQGRPVFSANDVRGSQNLEGLASGTYIVRVQSGGLQRVDRVTLK